MSWRTKLFVTIKKQKKQKKRKKTKNYYEALRWFYEESYEKKDYIRVKLKYAFTTISEEFDCHEYYDELIKIVKKKENEWKNKMER